MPDAKALRSVGQTYLRSWFHTSLHTDVVVPTGHRAIGTSFDRAVDHDGRGVGVMIYVRFDAADKIVAIYAYAGHWAYPV